MQYAGETIHGIPSLLATIPCLSGFGSKAKLGWAGHVKDGKLRLEEDVTIDGEANPSVSLNTAKTSCSKVRPCQPEHQ